MKTSMSELNRKRRTKPAPLDGMTRKTIDYLLRDVSTIANTKIRDINAVSSCATKYTENTIPFNMLNSESSVVRRLAVALIALIFEQKSDIFRYKLKRNTDGIFMDRSKMFLTKKTPSIKTFKPEPLAHVTDVLLYYLPLAFFPTGLPCYLDMNKLINILISKEYHYIPDPREAVIWMDFEDDSLSLGDSGGSFSDQCLPSESFDTYESSESEHTVENESPSILRSAVGQTMQSKLSNETNQLDSVSNEEDIKKYRKIKIFSFMKDGFETRNPITKHDYDEIKSKIDYRPPAILKDATIRKNKPVGVDQRFPDDEKIDRLMQGVFTAATVKNVVERLRGKPADNKSIKNELSNLPKTIIDMEHTGQPLRGTSPSIFKQQTTKKSGHRVINNNVMNRQPTRSISQYSSEIGGNSKVSVNLVNLDDKVNSPSRVSRQSIVMQGPKRAKGFNIRPTKAYRTVEDCVMESPMHKLANEPTNFGNAVDRHTRSKQQTLKTHLSLNDQTPIMRLGMFGQISEKKSPYNSVTIKKRGLLMEKTPQSP